ncbi:DegQ family serine endoprotease [Marinobacterium jannaschii]|uniref:DegQ family serine endoprotease n=1 Tax=Marinobacterium jannaschii TaxID=64970 RepID=UPI002ADE6FCE|nr:DegQ family serine endoprotease [Marinobacterium jannaschii]
MLKQVSPAVVNISTFSRQQYSYNPLLNDPFFRRFFNVPEQRQYSQPSRKKQQSAGSGVIVDAEGGIVMTNYHVIKGADEVQVSLYDGRSYQAQIIGADPELDIAVLSIESNGLVEVGIADSNKLEVGDFVVAIGNPFGLGQTVTTGIVSALGRSGLGIEGYENFIQTDASINPGNSGGALVNLAGELVGINTAIIAPSGGNVGIGFAIPINMARASMQQILKHGEVRRGQIGIGIQEITPDLRRAFNLSNGQTGVLVSNVAQSSPAADAGLQSGDIILSVDGQSVSSSGQLRSLIGIKAVGEPVTLLLLRDGKKLTRQVKVAEPQASAAANGYLHGLLEGVGFDNAANKQGVVVSNLAPNSAAAFHGLRPGDLIVAANRRRVYDLESFRKALQRSPNSVLLRVERGGGSFFVVIR